MTEFSDVTQKTSLDGTELALGASNATQTIPQKYSQVDLARYGAGPDKGDWVNLRNYITGEPTRDMDCSAALQAAHNDAAAAKVGVWVPYGEYGLATTVHLKAGMSGPEGACSFHGLGVNHNVSTSPSRAAAFFPLMSNGDWMMSVGHDDIGAGGGVPDTAGSSAGIGLSNFVLYADINGPSTPSGAKGLNLGWTSESENDGSVSGAACNRGVFRNLAFHGLDIALAHSGWISEFSNIWIKRCVQGLDFYWVSDLIFTSLAIENTYKGVYYRRASGCTFSKFSDEGTGSGTEPSQFIELSGCTFNMFRNEHNGTGRGDGIPMFEFTSCSGLTFLACNLRGLRTKAPVMTIDADGLFMQGKHQIATSDSQGYPCFTLTSSTARTAIIQMAQATVVGLPDMSIPSSHAATTLSRPSNVFPGGDNGLRFPCDIEAINCVVQSYKNSGVTVGDKSNIRLRADAGTHSVGIHFSFNSTDHAETCRSMQSQITLGMWIWVPDDIRWKDGTFSPFIEFGSNGVPNNSNNSRSGLNALNPDSWNFISTGPGSMSSSSTDQKDIWLWLDNKGTATFSGYDADPNEHLMIGSIQVSRGWANSYMLNGGLAEDGTSGYRRVNQNNVSYTCSKATAAAAQANTAMNSWETGDKFYYTDPTDFEGVVRIGSDWKTFGPISA